MNRELISRIVKPALSKNTAKIYHHRGTEGLPTPRKAKTLMQDLTRIHCSYHCSYHCSLLGVARSASVPRW
jgi:hypothetical protein